jgi:hypothetical protein
MDSCHETGDKYPDNDGGLAPQVACTLQSSVVSGTVRYVAIRNPFAEQGLKISEQGHRAPPGDVARYLGEWGGTKKETISLLDTVKWAGGQVPASSAVSPQVALEQRRAPLWLIPEFLEFLPQQFRALGAPPEQRFLQAQWWGQGAAAVQRSIPSTSSQRRHPKRCYAKQPTVMTPFSSQDLAVVVFVQFLVQNLTGHCEFQGHGHRLWTPTQVCATHDDDGGFPRGLESVLLPKFALFFLWTQS